MTIKKGQLFSCAVALLASASLLTSCGGQKALIIPRAISTAEAVSVKDLDMQRGDYDILNTITETASVRCEYHKDEIRIISSDGDFSYRFKFDPKSGWKLESFSGVASFGYLTSDINNQFSLPDPEEFARRSAIARIISALKDYGADGVIEPVTTTIASQSGRNAVEFKAKVSAKLIKLKTDN